MYDFSQQGEILVIHSSLGTGHYLSPGGAEDLFFFFWGGGGGRDHIVF